MKRLINGLKVIGVLFILVGSANITTIEEVPLSIAFVVLGAYLLLQ